jgi:hypothetical protein
MQGIVRSLLTSIQRDGRRFREGHFRSSLCLGYCLLCEVSNIATTGDLRATF